VVPSSGEKTRWRQAALYGVLAEVEGLGLELIEVRRLPPEPS